MASLDLSSDVVDLTAALVDIESVSGNEREITDAIESALAPVPRLEIWRHGHTLIARTNQGRSERVVIAGHVDTVPINQTLPSRRDAENLHGLGSCDMKSGVAVLSSDSKLRLALNETKAEIHVTSDGTIVIESTGNLTIKSSAHVSLEAAGQVKIKGAIVDIDGTPITLN